MKINAFFPNSSNGENNFISALIEKLANDLQNAFPGMAGFSKRNIFRIQAFYATYQIVPQAVAQFRNVDWFVFFAFFSYRAIG